MYYWRNRSLEKPCGPRLKNLADSTKRDCLAMVFACISRFRGDGAGTFVKLYFFFVFTSTYPYQTGVNIGYTTGGEGLLAVETATT